MNPERATLRSDLPGRWLFVAAVLLLSFALRSWASCRCGQGALDLVLVIDTTGSMHLAIGTVKAQMARIVEVLAGRFEELRVGVVAYRTTSGPKYVIKAHELSSDVEQIKLFLQDLRASGGGGEAVYEGLEAAVNNQPWAPDSRKVIILVGDEPPAQGTREQAVSVAMQAAEKGIVVHSITMSETAWRYFEFNNPQEFKRMKDEDLVGRHPERDFVMPSFLRISEVSKGSAVPGTDARSIVKWLLALSSGDSSLGKAAEEVMQLEPEGPAVRSGSLPVLFARLKFKGACDTPRDTSRFLEHLDEYLPADSYRAIEQISAADGRLQGIPVLYVSGHGKVILDREEEAALKEYIERGGTVWADACCGNEEFIDSINELAKRLYPDRPLKGVGEGHALFRSAVRVQSVRYTIRHRTAEYREGLPEAKILALGDGRPGIILTPHSWGAGWGSYPFGKPCLMHDDDALALSMNLVVYLLEARWCRM